MSIILFTNERTIFLFQRLEQRHRMEAELRQRIEQLEKRQTQDDAVLNVVNRYWNQLNEDIRVLLQRFDAETADESENKSKNYLLFYFQIIAVRDRSSFSFSPNPTFPLLKKAPKNYN